ncbi:hypothetical protein T484DRAFT_1969914 [Baffinella frigidus]|nr:hypothetical protein T484DRAFT_1969914 [Cryptophyta sp. CCMP2293]
MMCVGLSTRSCTVLRPSGCCSTVRYGSRMSRTAPTGTAKLASGRRQKDASRLLISSTMTNPSRSSTTVEIAPCFSGRAIWRTTVKRPLCRQSPMEGVIFCREM